MKWNKILTVSIKKKKKEEEFLYLKVKSQKICKRNMV